MHALLTALSSQLIINMVRDNSDRKDILHTYPPIFILILTFCIYSVLCDSGWASITDNVFVCVHSGTFVYFGGEAGGEDVSVCVSTYPPISPT